MTVLTRSRPLSKPSRFVRLALALALVSNAGCTREFFRNWADQDVTEAVFEKSRDPRFRIDMFTVEPPSLSRFANPYDPDRPPAPPDDYAAEALSPMPQWPKHRLLTPIEGTGYLDRMEEWQRQRPPLPRGERVPDSGPTGIPEPTGIPGLPPPDMGPSPFRLESDFFGPGMPGLTPIPGRGVDDIAPPSPEGPDGFPPFRPEPPEPGLPPDGSEPQTRTSPKDTAVQLAAYQEPETTPDEELQQPPIEGVDPDLEREAQELLEAEPPSPEEILPGLPGIGPEDYDTTPGLEFAEEGPERDILDILRPEDVIFDEPFAAGLGEQYRPLVIDPRQALTMALQNSRVYQFRLEDVYITALATTFQRFQFEPQFIAGMSPTTGTTAGSVSPNPANTYTLLTSRAPGGPASIMNVGTVAGFGKLFSFGTRLVGGFANQTIINFGGPAAVTAETRSFLPLSITQPFLRSGGRAFVLEALTQAERNLLYEVRSFTRFRREFFVSIMTGAAVGGGDPAIGYLPLLQQLQILENNTKVVAAYQRILEVFRELAQGAGSNVSPIDIIQVENTLQSQRLGLVGTLLGYRNNLDLFRQQLGFPPDTPMIPDRSLISTFRDVYDEIDSLEYKPREVLVEMVNQLPELEDVILDGRSTIGLFRQAHALDRERQRIEQRRADRASLVLEIQGLVNDQRFVEDRIRSLEEVPFEEEDPRDATLFRLQLEEAQQDLEFLREQQIEAQERLDELRPEDDPRDEAEVRRLLTEAAQLRQRSEDNLEDLIRAAERIALENRLDLMNARAQLYDAWRQFAVTANQLRGILNSTYSSQILTPPDTTNPFGFDNRAKQIQITLNAELPLVRLLERNNFVQAKINYERQRRLLMQTEDSIKFQVRQGVRSLQTFYEQYEINKTQFVVALIQQDQTFQRYLEPPRPGAAAAAGGNQVLVLVSGINQVNTSQNSLVSNWVQYQTQRLSLYRDLEIMPYDEWEAFYELFPSANYDRGPAGAGPGPNNRPAPAPAPAPPLPGEAGP